MSQLRRLARCVTLLLVLAVAPAWADTVSLAIAPGEPGGKLDRRLLAELGERLEADHGPGALRVLYLDGAAPSAEALRRELARRDLADVHRVILLHDAAVAAYRRLQAAGAEPVRRLVAYGAFVPANRRWLSEQGAAHLDLLPVLWRGLSWVRHGSEARRLIGWVAPGSPMLALGDSLLAGRDRLDAVRVLGRDARVVEPGTANVLLGLPDREARRLALPLLGNEQGAWCLMPEWLADGCLGGVQPEPAGVVTGLLAGFERGDTITAPASPRLDYAARSHLSADLRDRVRYANVPAAEASRRGTAQRLLIGALLLGGGAVIALGVALVAERRRRRRRERFGFDSLTGLPGRPRLERRMQRYHDNRHPFQVCWIAFDLLDGLQETHGAKGTQEALKRVGKRLRRVARGEGYVVRLEGEAFAVMSFLPGDDRGGSPAGMMFAERLQESLSAPFHVGDADHLLLPRIGVARSANDKTPFDMLEEAQAAARQVLRGGERRPRVLEAEAVAPEERCLALTEELAGMSAERLAESLVLEVEPRFLLADRRGCGGEIAARWPHPRWGEVPGEELVRLAEAAGRRARLDRAVCRLGLEAVAEAGLPTEAPAGPRSARPLWTLPVGVPQLVDKAFVDALAERCEALGLATSGFELQWRGAELGDPWPLESAVRYCRERGFGVALKGLVHSRHALDAIFRQPLSRLVLEPRLLSGVPGDQSSILLIKSLRDMAKLAGRHITVTGVATSEQLLAIRGMNFVSVQGPLFGAVQPFEALAEALAGGGEAVPPAPASPGDAAEESASPASGPDDAPAER